MARMLAFDFANDPAVLDLKDEYLFGRFLVCPVTHPMNEQTTRRVYLPSGERWIDYWTGNKFEGGKWIEQKVTIDRLPLFVRSGSIIPTTEEAQYTDAQVGLPVTIHIYSGKDAHLVFYEDEGDNYNFEHRAFSTIPLEWDEDKQVLTIGKREGCFEGMLRQRTFIVDKDGVQKQVSYEGKRIKVKIS